MHRLNPGVSVEETLKLTSAQVVETSVTNNSSFQNYTHPDDHTIRNTHFKSFRYTSKVECQTTRPLDNSPQTIRPRTSDSAVDKRTKNYLFGSGLKNELSGYPKVDSIQTEVSSIQPPFYLNYNFDSLKKLCCFFWISLITNQMNRLTDYQLQLSCLYGACPAQTARRAV